MNLPLSYSKYNTFLSCPVKYAHQYILKTPAVDELTYPLALGQLVHLFVQLYNEGKYTKKQLRELKENLSELHNLIHLQYPSIYGKVHSIQSINVSENVEKLIKIINDTEALFFHALKLFGIYKDMFFPKINQCSDSISEATFHNIINYDNSLMVCLYGSIDLLFYHNFDNLLKFVYFSDYKTGKQLYDSYYEQLYFYVYNVTNYNFDAAQKIKGNTDDFSRLTYLKQNMTDENTYMLLFNVREGVPKSMRLAESREPYEKFVEEMHNNIKNDIREMHVLKKDLKVVDLFGQYKDAKNMCFKEECGDKEEAFSCAYCKFAEQCDYRIKR